MTTSKSRFTLKSTLSTGLKIAFVFLVFWWLAKKNLISISAFVAGLKNWPEIVVGFSALTIASFFAAYRWNLLLKVQDISLKPSRLLQLHFIGNFFNVALPGAVSGDFVKAFYIARESPGNRAKAFGSILFDRVLGLSALVVVSLSALVIEMNHFIGSPILAGIKVFVITSGVAVFTFYTYLFFVREHHDPVLKILTKLEERKPKLGSLVRIYLGIRVYHSHRVLVMKTLAVACAIHILAAFSCLCFARALGEVQIPTSGLFVVAPLGLLVTALPILPGGVGTGHAAFSFLFNLLGSERGADIFSYYVLIQLLLGAFGGVIYLRFKAAAPEMTADLLHEMDDATNVPDGAKT